MVVFEEMFRESKGKPVDYHGQTIQMKDEIATGKSARLRVEFESTNSEWRQGVALTTGGMFEVGGQRIKDAIVLWEDTAPQQVDIAVTSKSGRVEVKNVWDVGNGVIESWHNGAAMIVDVDGAKRRYRCNDGHPDEDFDDLVFELTTLRG